jgi:hypothetical protein
MAGLGTMSDAALDSMLWIYRAQMYALRAIRRGVLLPFRGTRVRKKAVCKISTKKIGLRLKTDA